MQCATHPSVETELACGRCGKAICPRCLVQTPVGSRCRQCANVRRIPTYNIGTVYMLRGLGASLAAGASLGVVWGFLLPIFGILFAILAGAGLGYAVGESISAATNRKRGLPLQVVAVVGVLAAFLIRSVIEFGAPVSADDVAGYIVAGVAAFSAISRLK